MGDLELSMVSSQKYKYAFQLRDILQRVAFSSVDPHLDTRHAIQTPVKSSDSVPRPTSLK